MKSQTQFKKTFSCEFFPPRTDKGWENWRATLVALGELNPAYFSCTYGAGGTTQEGTLEAVKEISAAGFSAAPHITCIGSTQQKIADLLNTYKELGINRIVALRGDLPEGQQTTGEFHYANELVSFIRDHSGDHFHIEVAAYPETHPEASSRDSDLQHFADKVRAGADAAITQYFFNINSYLEFVEGCEAAGLSLPIVPGIMPITNCKQLLRFSDNCGAVVPQELRDHLESFGDDLEAIREFGLEVVTRLCEELLAAGAPGLHFYTLNKAEATTALWHNLGLPTASS
jgi:methylenetetrahydrofolate reductase (NADPH)